MVDFFLCQTKQGQNRHLGSMDEVEVGCFNCFQFFAQVVLISSTLAYLSLHLINNTNEVIGGGCGVDRLTESIKDLLYSIGAGLYTQKTALIN